jgi:hypothetical protein
MPAEHGAWGILIVPFLCAAVIAAASSHGSAVPLTLAAVSVLGVFLLRGSLQSHGHWRALFLPAHLALAGLTAAAATLLIFLYERHGLLAVGAAGLALYLFQYALTRNHQRQSEKRSLAAELVGVVLLTLSAPAATISMLGQLDARGAQVWLLNVLFFLGGVLYVKYRVRGLLAHRPFPSLAERYRFAWPVFVYHLLLALLLACAVFLDSLPLLALVAFAPAVLRAHGLLFHLGRRFPIKRLGWSEVAHSLLFAVLLILASRT